VKLYSTFPPEAGLWGAVHWLKWRTGGGKGADAKTVTQVLDLAARRGNRGNLGRGIPLERDVYEGFCFKKSGLEDAD